jgi:hypothetical protein
MDTGNTAVTVSELGHACAFRVRQREVLSCAYAEHS